MKIAIVEAFILAVYAPFRTEGYKVLAFPKLTGVALPQTFQDLLLMHK